MASIRVGFFEDFKGADTLLLDVDHEGLNALIAWLQTAASSGQKIALEHCPGAVVQSGLYVDLSCAPNDTGLVRSEGTEFVWQRSEEGWVEVIDKLAAMENGACHQYLEGPSDDVQVIASIGEYGDSWWRSHGG
ncbi:MAG: hypothetical protein LC808_40735 [Actinobacteria bacterium]|nr:hypothetical protein [Acidobacteriota bacterium]MCA1709274.1 hypothetical protein [Actinomycetota bacterium]